MKCILAQFQQESNSFSPIPGDMEKFKGNCLIGANALLPAFENTATELGGFIHTLRGAGADIVPAVAAGCVSCGPVTDEVCSFVLSEIFAAVEKAGGADCLLLCLHGAMLLQSHPDGTGHFLQALRERLGSGVLIAATLDSHANLTQRMLDNADILAGYKTYPHIDLFETGCRAAKLALQTLSGKCRPVMRMRKLPMILNAEAAQTGEFPMKAVMEAAAGIEGRPGVLSASVFQVQSWLNVEDTGCACLVMTDSDAAAAQSLADSLAHVYWGLRHDFRLELMPLDQAVKNAMAEPPGRPVIFADSADGTGSGSPGDSPAILRELLLQKFSQKACLTIVDAPAVQAAIDVGIGNEGSFFVGGSIDRARHMPVQVTGRVKTLSDGSFVLKGPQSTGNWCHMGRTAVVQAGEIYIVLMERSANNWDPSLYRSLGLEPMDARVVVVKSPAAFRAAYAGMYEKAYLIDAPGASSANFANLPFDRIKRPMHPFDNTDALCPIPGKDEPSHGENLAGTI